MKCKMKHLFGFIFHLSSFITTRSQVVESQDCYSTGAMPPHIRLALGPDDFPTVITTRGHTLRADEPASSGGSDTGPEPFEVLLASLGACTAITLRMYARRKGWALDGVQIDAGFDPNEGRRLIRMTLSCNGDLTPDQRARLLQIANACPVHKALTTGVMVDTRMADRVPD
jgi:putative redox protein